ncbi:MAG: M48 family metalloprotease [Deltaproteobacteria bacterium]|nr:M48 family metalloprotease [Deltaproteobacteria bacterium]
MKHVNRREFLGVAGRWVALGLGAGPVLSALASGCGGGLTIGVGPVVIESDSVKKTAKAVARSFKDITPEQEYYIGRSVGAVITGDYGAYDNEKANMYMNVLGQTLARASDLPETFGGYHFLILDSEEINALAAPGGLIFVTRGMLRCCGSEDGAAAVLAHEIGHVQLRHGLQVIRKSRITKALSTFLGEGAKTAARGVSPMLAEAFDGAISDVASALIYKGYSPSFEREADIAAVTILERVGYNPNALVDILTVIEQRLKPGDRGFGKTHPSPAGRMAAIHKRVEAYPALKIPQARQARFRSALEGG